ncbi:MAG: hypothetical protein IJW98_03790 [Clostridia bacterium]|nr:hypothetical protein [Clostridia bacterium]
MKGYFSIFLSVSILFSLFAFAGLGGVFATDTISITADKTVLVVGQTATLTVTLPDDAENISVDINDEGYYPWIAVGDGSQYLD